MTGVASSATKTGDTATESGVYVCTECESALFSSTHSIDSCAHACSFDAELHDGAVRYQSVHDHGLDRIDVYCNTCGACVGNVFVNEPTTTGKRFSLREDAVAFHPVYE